MEISAIDFDALYQSGLDLWVGQYTGLYPLAANGLFALLALLPRQIAYGVLVALSAAVYALVLKRRVFAWLLYVPFWQTLFAGQLDLLALGLVANGSGLALALLTLKPQLLIFAAPALVAFPQRVKSFVLWTLAIHAPATIAQPDWIGEWLSRMGGEGRWGDPLNPSLWVVPVLALVVLAAVVLWRRDAFMVVATSLNPTLRYYDAAMLAGRSLWAIPVSWAALALCIRFNVWWPVSLIGVVIWAVSNLRGEFEEHRLWQATRQFSLPRL